MNDQTVILGGGVTGLAAGVSSGLPVYEARSEPGGICSSYYVAPGYRFERGGGHWIFGENSAALAFIQSLVELRSYSRNSGVLFSRSGQIVPFPLQYHLSYLNRKTALKAVEEMRTSTGKSCFTLKEWLRDRFGPTLCDLFFGPFHQRYTAGLWERVAPQDDYKSPIRIEEVVKGLEGKAAQAGYNVTFRYPAEGLDTLVSRMAQRTKIFFGKRVVRIDLTQRRIVFQDGTEIPYQRIVSTVPLCKILTLTGLRAGEPDPYTSVLVINVGAIRAKACPDHHWLYVPDSRAGFHRVGFYSNVDRSFLPSSPPKQGAERVSLYVEYAFLGGHRLPDVQIQRICRQTVEELTAWGLIEEVEAIDPTWIDVAYTWTLPGSSWKEKAFSLLESHGIHPVGRYGRWVFQGIADSIREGLKVGERFR